jgi:hypothetical protein
LAKYAFIFDKGSEAEGKVREGESYDATLPLGCLHDSPEAARLAQPRSALLSVLVEVDVPQKENLPGCLGNYVRVVRIVETIEENVS